MSSAIQTTVERPIALILHDIETILRAMGGSGAPPELLTSDMPEKKHHNHKKKR